MKRLLLISTLLSLSMVSYGEIYQYTGSDGSISFTDIENVDAKTKPIEVEDENKYSPRNTPTADNEADESSEDNALNNQSLQRLAMLSPRTEQTFQNQPVIPISVSVTPALREKQVVIIYVDGQVKVKGHRLQFSLHNLARGKHIIKAELLDSTGNIIQSTAPVTINVHYTSRLTSPIPVP